MSRRVGGIFKAAGLLTGTVLVAMVAIGWWVWKGHHSENE